MKLQEFIKPRSIKIWRGDFEHDNFGIDQVLNEINKELKSHNLKEIKRHQVLKRSKDSVALMKAIEIVCGELNRIDLYRLIPKKILAQRIIKDRILEIQKEKMSPHGWKPKLPIEKVLHRIFRTIPVKSFTFTDY